MLSDCPEESQTFIKKLITENKTHLLKFDYYYTSYCLIDLLCETCGCILQLNYKSEEVIFYMSGYDVPGYENILDCNEVIIKKLLE